MKKFATTTALIILAITAGSSEPIEFQTQTITLFDTPVSEWMATYWKHVALLGTMSAGVFLSILRK